MAVAESGVTRGVLADSLRQLMRAKPLSGVTVGDICETAGMNRKSFYYHFRDKYDLVNWMFFTGFSERMLCEEQPNPLLTLCAFLAADKAFWRAALKPAGQNSLQEYLGEVLAPMVSDCVSRQTSAALAPADRAFCTRQLTALWQQAVISWVNGGCNPPPERFVALMARTGTLLAGMNETTD